MPGELLAAATAQAAEGTGIAVRPIRCLANCNRGLSAAVRRDGAWTYVFGGLDPLGGADALIEGAKRGHRVTNLCFGLEKKEGRSRD